MFSLAFEAGIYLFFMYLEYIWMRTISIAI